MARGKQQLKITSITDAKASGFTKSADIGATLFCERVTGLHLIKQVRGCAWRFRYSDAQGKRRTATIGKYPAMLPVAAAETALEWLANESDPLREKKQRYHDRKQATAEAERRTFRIYLEGEYARHMKTWSPKSAKANTQRFYKHFPEFLDRDMATLSRQDVNEWQSWQEAKTKRPAHSSIRRLYVALKALLNQAVADEILGMNPLSGHRLRPPPFEDQKNASGDPVHEKRRMLTPQEMHGLLNGLTLFAEEIRRQRRNSRAHGKPNLPDLDAITYPHWFIPFCRVALNTGWRPGDLYALKWDEVDMRFSGKLRRYSEKSKAVANRRGLDGTLLETPLPESIKTLLSDWKKQQGDPDTGLVFPSSKKGKQLGPQAHKRAWVQVKKLGGMPETLQFYALRHHAISVMVAAGIPLLTVAKLVGHKDTAMIQKHYGHLCPDSARSAMDVVAATIDKARQSGLREIDNA